MKLSSWIVFIAVLGPASVSSAQNAIVGELFAADASVRGSVLLAGTGTKIVSGSSVTAGDAAAVFRLSRGGEVRICPTTSITLTSSKTGRELMIGMSTGSLEAHYNLGMTADTIVTPDFRIMLAGPGTFSFAIKADEHGNAAIKALSGNTASLIVSELNGDSTYQVKPNEEVLFHDGKLANPDHAVPPDCGCPPLPQIERAAVEVPKDVAKPAVQKQPSLPVVPLRPVPEQHLEQVPLVYQAGPVADEVVAGVARLRLTARPMMPNPIVLAPPPPPEKAAVVKPPEPEKKKTAKHGLFRKVGAFFAAIFH